MDSLDTWLAAAGLRSKWMPDAADANVIPRVQGSFSVKGNGRRGRGRPGTSSGHATTNEGLPNSTMTWPPLSVH